MTRKAMVGLAGLGAAILASVVGVASSSSPAKAGDTATKGFRLAGLSPISTDPYFVSIDCGALSVAKKSGGSMSWQGPVTADVPQALQAFNSLVLTKPDGIIVSPFSPTAFSQAIKKAMASGIPVVITDNKPTQPVALQNVITTLGSSVSDIAHRIANSMHGKGAISVIASEPGNPQDEPRYKPLLRALAKDYPGIKVLPVQYVNQDTNKESSIVSAQLVANPDLKVVYSTDGSPAMGAVSAIKAAKKTGKVAVYTFDADPQEVAALRAGAINGLIALAPYVEGQRAAQTLIAWLKKHKGEKNVKPLRPNTISSPVKLLTRANINTPTGKEYTYRSSCG